MYASMQIEQVIVTPSQYSYAASHTAICLYSYVIVKFQGGKLLISLQAYLSN